ncbi:MAG TPA: ABC-F family ATP-binding cassette domain-containing protein [Bacteroidia bacterium]|nr:ABC-F family ATP-binding cassette domain-containing protein [Bacteroidia bacterium]
MNYLTTESLSKAYNETPLFEDLNISLSANQKMALIAANGSGKTTLLRILAGKETPDTGKVTMRNGITLGYLEQQPEFHPDSMVMDCIFKSDHPVLHALGEYEKCLDQGEKADQHLMQQLIDKIDSLQAWDFENKAHEILGKLGIHDLEKQIKHLSGGQKKRVALAKLLVEEPDLLLLDEPTNHLDLDMIEWLENYLRSLNKTVLLVTHDRYFLDSVCDTISELDQGVLYTYTGNYKYYLEKKTEREFQQASEMEKTKNIYLRELDWMRRQPKARTTKQKARIDSFHEVEEKVGSKRIEDKMNLTMQMQRMGSKILELENICKSYNDKTLLKDFSYTFKRGEKIGIVGKNGVGKSTLLNMIMGTVKPDKGRIKQGETILFGYYSQDGIQLKEDKRVIDVVKDIAEYVETGKGKGKWINAGQFLTHFNFSGSRQHAYVSKLSGGEKRRLYLLTILIKNPNFLILDEPTNDLDIVTLNILEDFLQEYEGCILMVTHDRYFMDKLVDHVFVFEGDGKIRDIHGNYTDYRNEAATDSKQLPGNRRQAAEGSRQSGTIEYEKKKGLTFKEKKELEALEKEMSELEKQKEDLINKMSNGSLVHDELQKSSVLYHETLKKIDLKTERWMELSEKM